MKASFGLAAALLVFSAACDCRSVRIVDGDGGSGASRGGSGGVSSEGGGGSPGFCGDGVVSGVEQCDGLALAGASCVDIGFANPAGVTCSPTCILQYDGCKPECGNSAIEPTESCDDGNKASGDGCSSDCLVEESECSTAEAVNLSAGTTVLTGSLATVSAASHQPVGDTGCPPGIGLGPEKVYAITPQVDGHLSATLTNAGTNFDTVLYSRDTCDGPSSQLSCHDNVGSPAGEVISGWVSAFSTVYLFVDTAQFAAGEYSLTLDLSRGGTCDDPVPITIDGPGPYVLRGSLIGLSPDDTAEGCNQAGAGPDAVYALTFTQSGDYTIDLTTSGFDSVSYIRMDCQGQELDCSSPSNTTSSQVTASVSAGQTRYLWIDTSDASAGEFTLTVHK
ncbi:MAG: DUF4215 domain-containing protein [Polyangiaceae bacterium]